MVGVFWLVSGAFWLVVGAFWLVVGAFWLVVDAFWLVVDAFWLVGWWLELFGWWLVLGVIGKKMVWGSNGDTPLYYCIFQRAQCLVRGKHFHTSISPSSPLGFLRPCEALAIFSELVPAHPRFF